MAARFRSRSPHGSKGDIVTLILEREQARLNKDFAAADTIRERLTGLGVTLFDKTSSWKCVDGRTGRIPSWSEIEAGVGPESVMAYNGGSIASGSENDDPVVVHIKQLVVQREQARAAKDFDKSDELREELKGLGVDLFDKDKLWRAKTGQAGVIVGYSSSPTDVEITTLVVQREKARHSGDYGTGDMIRQELKERGVSIFDKDSTWRTEDGRFGQVPSWSQVLGGDGAKAAGAPAPVSGGKVTAAQLQAALSPLQRPTPAALEMQNAVLRAALLSHTRGGQQRLGAGGQQRLGAGGRGDKPQAQARPAIGPAGRQSAELAEAVGFCRQAQASGRRAADAEIIWLVEAREKMRQAKDFNSADSLRQAMKENLGIELYEREKRWVTADGRQGVIPLWQNSIGQ